MARKGLTIDGVYAAWVQDELQPVRVEGQDERGGWVALNLSTGRRVRIDSMRDVDGELQKAPDGRWAYKAPIGAFFRSCLLNVRPGRARRPMRLVVPEPPAAAGSAVASTPDAAAGRPGIFRPRETGNANEDEEVFLL